MGIQSDFFAMFFEGEEIGIKQGVFLTTAEHQFWQGPGSGQLVDNCPYVFLGLYIGVKAPCVGNDGLHSWVFRIHDGTFVAGLKFAKINWDCGEHCCSGKFVRVVYGKLDGSPSSHGQTCNEVVFPFVGYREPAVDKRHKFLRNVIIHVVAHHGIRPVGIVGIESGRHYHNKVFFSRVKLYVGFPYPVAVVAEGSMEQPEHLVFFAAQIEILRGNFSFFVG